MSLLNYASLTVISTWLLLYFTTRLCKKNNQMIKFNRNLCNVASKQPSHTMHIRQAELFLIPHSHKGRRRWTDMATLSIDTQSQGPVRCHSPMVKRKPAWFHRESQSERTRRVRENWKALFCRPASKSVKFRHRRFAQPVIRISTARYIEETESVIVTRRSGASRARRIYSNEEKRRRGGRRRGDEGDEGRERP